MSTCCSVLTVHADLRVYVTLLACVCIPRVRVCNLRQCVSPSCTYVRDPLRRCDLLPLIVLRVRVCLAVRVCVSGLVRVCLLRGLVFQ
jgi:hypothetical protein